MPGYNQSTNRYVLGGTSYDASGNLLNDTFHTYTWDGFGKVMSIDSTACGSNGICFTYDAFGQLVEKNSSGAYSQIEYSPTGKVAVLNSGGTWVRGYVPLPGGEILAPTPDTFWHTDWLGSVRLASSAPNRTITFDRAFAPFGELYNTVTGGTTTPDFAGLTRDAISDEGDTPNREYHQKQSRWISPDPLGMGAADPSNPQSWNLYAYVLNNPLALSDPSGLWCVWGDGTHDDPHSSGGLDEDECRSAGGYWDATNSVTGCDDNTGTCTGPSELPGQFNVCGPGGGSAVCFTSGINPVDTFTATGSAPGNWGTPLSSGPWYQWGLNFTKSFFTLGGGQSPNGQVVPTCAGVTLDDIADHLAGDLVRSMTAEQTLKAAGSVQTARAVKYAAGRPNFMGGKGLIYPNKSSVYRGMMKNARFLGEAAEALPIFEAAGAGVKSTPGVTAQARRGECAAALPIF